MYANTLIKGIVDGVHAYRRGDGFVKNFCIVSEHSGTKVVSSAWSDTVMNIESIKNGAYATARGYFRPVSFTRRDGSSYRGREFVVTRICALPDYELSL